MFTSHQIRQKLQSSLSLEWWKYGYIGGIILPIPSLVIGDHTMIVISLHLLLDFVVQSPQTAHRKATGDCTALLLHSLISGFFPLIWLDFKLALISALVHLAIDACQKFGLKNWQGGLVDQTLHLISLVILTNIY